MSENVLYSKVAVELLELMNYFDKSLKEKIPQDFEEKLNKIKSESYTFKVDTSKSLEDQNILPETRNVLFGMYVQYGCSLEEKKEIYRLKTQQNETIKETVDKVENAAINDTENVTQLVDSTKLPWYKKIFLGFKRLFNK